jgi:hypothetical protein
MSSSLAHVTRESILKAIKECDQLGKEAFLKKHGFKDSTKYVLRHGGKDYPSKAIVGVAAGYKSSEFSGGAAKVGALLQKFGFDFEQLAFGFAAAVAAGIIAASAPADAAVDTRPTAASGKPATYFASGSNRPADIRGFARIGHAIGVAADEVSATAENELMSLAGMGVEVFVDSGAFSEVEFNPAKMGFDVVKPIDAADWQERLDLYARLGAVLGSQLHVVAPDMVGNQVVTLQRLAKYAEEMRALRSLGCHILVPIQKGAMSQVEFDKKVEAVLGFNDYVRALPCKKGATTVDELRAFCAARKPAKLHLLGLGVKNRQADDFLAVIAEESPDSIVTMDSNKIAASVGRGNGKPRILTAARDMAEKLIAAGRSAITHVQELAIVLAFGAGFQLSML